MAYVKPRRDFVRLLRGAYKHRTDAWRLKETVDTVMDNGLGRHICQLQRLTFVLEKSRSDSIGVRTFVDNNLVDFATNNPGIAVYVLPKKFKGPYLIGEYLNGRRCQVSLAKMSDEEVSAWVEHLRSRSGRRIAAFDHNVGTETPSIQGMWDPFATVPSCLNTNTQWPHEGLSEYDPIEPTATEIVRQIYFEDQSQIDEEHKEEAVADK